MNSERAMLSIVMFAAFADGAKDQTEREHLKQFAQQMGSNTLDLMGIYQDVLLKKITLSDATQALTDEGQRQYAYELAVCVCDSDGTRCEAEDAFLDQLQGLLGLSSDATRHDLSQHADEIAAAGALMPSTSDQAIPPAVNPQPAHLDKMVLNYAIANGALELLPQSWASVAIIPMQIKMVYRVGKAYGHELDQGHIREFLATVGVGLTSQYIEQFGRKLVGGLLGSVLGKTGKKVGRAATGMALSFATTYALGQVAIRYYAGGRQMSAALLKQTFSELLEPAKRLQTEYLPQIQQKASTLDASSVMSMVRGGV